jgi:hypothetical protein
MVFGGFAIFASEFDVAIFGQLSSLLYYLCLLVDVLHMELPSFYVIYLVYYSVFSRQRKVKRMRKSSSSSRWVREGRRMRKVLQKLHY